jgi:hypothetical protein
MAIEADFALRHAALGLVRHRRGIDLPARIAPDIAVDAGLESHRVQAIGEGAQAGIAPGTMVEGNWAVRGIIRPSGWRRLSHQPSSRLM